MEKFMSKTGDASKYRELQDSELELVSGGTVADDFKDANAAAVAAGLVNELSGAVSSTVNRMRNFLQSMVRH
jgi:hypothetical protein